MAKQKLNDLFDLVGESTADVVHPLPFNPQPVITPISDLWFGTSGPQDAHIVIVGEAWGADEDSAKQPFVGMSGQELTRILSDAKIDRKSCLITNTVAARPPKNDLSAWFGTKRSGFEEIRGLYPNSFVVSELLRLRRQLDAHPRKLIIAVGNYALWALSSYTNPVNITGSGGVKVPGGITNWRGSMLFADEFDEKTKLLPIIHPAAILRKWTDRQVTVHDLSARVPQALKDDWTPKQRAIVLAPPTYAQAVTTLLSWLRAADKAPMRLCCDIETTKKLLITCIGFAPSASFAMTIPFVKKVNNEGLLDSYWPPDQEAILTRLIARVLSHPNILIEGQNFIYDTQYLGEYVGVFPYCDFDTMLAFHLLFPGLPKGLDYLSSLFCTYHRYWKEDGKDWNTSKGTLEDHLKYNAEDNLRTFEIATTLRKLIVQFGMNEQWEWTKKKRDLALRAMRRAVLIDQKRRGQIAFELMTTVGQLQTQLLHIIPQTWIGPPGKRAGSKEPVYWFESNKQLKEVIGDFLGMPIPKSRKSKNDSLGKEAINELEPKFPQWAKLFSLLRDLRSARVFHTHFIKPPLEASGRMRCSFNPAGTETLRWSSSKNAFGRGANLQNLPKGTED